MYWSQVDIRARTTQCVVEVIQTYYYAKVCLQNIMKNSANIVLCICVGKTKRALSASIYGMVASASIRNFYLGAVRW